MTQSLHLRDHVVGVLGGTGPQGTGLARRFASQGLAVVIGSRQGDRAADAAREVGHGIRGLSNRDCARHSDIAIVAVPWAGHAALLSELASELDGKVVVDCVNPVGFDEHGPYAVRVPGGSAAEQAQLLLPGSRVVAAFHHVSAALLNDPDVATIDSDVLVLSDDRDAADLVRALTDAVPGMRGVYAGRLRNAGQVEAFTANLLAINRRYRTHAGVRLTGL